MLIGRGAKHNPRILPVFRSPTVTVEEHLASTHSIANLIDQTLLKPEATAEDIVRISREAAEHSFCAVCVNPHWVRLAGATLAGAKVRVCTVIGFPLGANRTPVKSAEARLALDEGAAEIDMVQNIGALRSGDFEAVQDEIAELAEIAHAGKALLKVILETCLLNDEQKRTACRLAAEAKADFVKTSTGFSTSGAKEDDIRLMRQTVGLALGVKAAGGIRSLDTLRRMVGAGATRIGTSSGVQILREFREGASSSGETQGAY
jgi:deoxyribose-phosphate aldolase